MIQDLLAESAVKNSLRLVKLLQLRAIWSECIGLESLTDLGLSNVSALPNQVTCKKYLITLFTRFAVSGLSCSL